MDLDADLIVDDFRLRTLTVRDAPLLVEATRAESRPAVWGPRPAGPYRLADARTALLHWTAPHGRVSVGALREGRLLAAFALMLDEPAGTAPAGNPPTGTAPAGTAPAGTAPAGTAPATSAPAGIAPATSGPAGSGPASSGPTRSAEVAYWVRPEERGQGLATRGVRALTDWAHRAGLTRLWLEIDPANEASIRVARGCGYRLEERQPNHCRVWTDDDPARDSWHDCLIWSHEVAAG